MINSETREILEAIDAGNEALESMRSARKYLNSARTWGIMDIFGGDFLTNVVKHSKMDHAREYLERANRDLERFTRELRDVPAEYLKLDAGGFLTFADFMFDGLLADVLVQSKINEARQQLDRMIPSTEDAIRKLKECLHVAEGRVRA